MEKKLYQRPAIRVQEMDSEALLAAFSGGDSASLPASTSTPSISDGSMVGAKETEMDWEE